MGFLGRNTKYAQEKGKKESKKLNQYKRYLALFNSKRPHEGGLLLITSLNN